MVKVDFLRNLKSGKLKIWEPQNPGNSKLRKLEIQESQNPGNSKSGKVQLIA